MALSTCLYCTLTRVLRKLLEIAHLWLNYLCLSSLKYQTNPVFSFLNSRSIMQQLLVSFTLPSILGAGRSVYLLFVWITILKNLQRLFWCLILKKMFAQLNISLYLSYLSLHRPFLHSNYQIIKSFCASIPVLLMIFLPHNVYLSSELQKGLQGSVSPYLWLVCCSSGVILWNWCHLFPVNSMASQKCQKF